MNFQDKIIDIRNAIFFMGVVFASIWAIIGINGFNNGKNIFLILITTIMSGFFLIISLSLLKIKPKNEEYNNTKRKKFRILFSLETIFIILTIILCNYFNRIDLIPVIISIIVGSHFFPLAFIYKIKEYYFTGILFLIVPIITILLIPEKIIFFNNIINSNLFIIGFDNAIILWGTSLIIYLKNKKIIKKFIKLPFSKIMDFLFFKK